MRASALKEWKGEDARNLSKRDIQTEKYSRQVTLN